MGLFDFIGKGLNLLGISQASEQRRQLSRQVRRKLNQKAPLLEIPLAYRQLLTSLNDQAMQLGDTQRTAIDQGFNTSLAKVLGQLNQRGLSSSALTANLTAANQKKKQEAFTGLEEMLLGQRLNMQQGLGTAGLATTANERAQLAGVQGQMYNQLTQPLLLPQGNNWLVAFNVLRG